MADELLSRLSQVNRADTELAVQCPRVGNEMVVYIALGAHDGPPLIPAGEKLADGPIQLPPMPRSRALSWLMQHLSNL